MDRRSKKFGALVLTLVLVVILDACVPAQPAQAPAATQVVATTEAPKATEAPAANSSCGG